MNLYTDDLTLNEVGRAVYDEIGKATKKIVARLMEVGLNPLQIEHILYAVQTQDTDFARKNGATNDTLQIVIDAYTYMWCSIRADIGHDVPVDDAQPLIARKIFTTCSREAARWAIRRKEEQENV